MFDRDFSLDLNKRLQMSKSSNEELIFASLWEDSADLQELQHLATGDELEEDEDREFTEEEQDDPPRKPLVDPSDNPLPELEKIQAALQKGAKAADLMPRLDTLLQLSLKTVGDFEVKYTDIRQRLGALAAPDNAAGAGYRAYIASLRAQETAYSAFSTANDALVTRRTPAIIQAYIKASTGIDNPAGGQFPPLSKEDFDLLLDMSLNEKKREEILAKLKRAEVRDRRLTPEGQPLLSKLVENYHATAKAWKDSIEEIKTKFAALAANVREDIAHHEELAPIMAAPRDTRILYLRVLSTAMRQSTDDTATVQMLTKSQQLHDELQALGFGPTGERLTARSAPPERFVPVNTDTVPEPPPQTTYPEHLHFYNDPLMLHQTAGELIIMHKCKFGPQVMKILDTAIDSADRINVKAFEELREEATAILREARAAGDTKLQAYLNANKELETADKLYQAQLLPFLRALGPQEAAYLKAGATLTPPLTRADILVLVDPTTDSAAKKLIIERLRAIETADPTLRAQPVSALLGDNYLKAAERARKAIEERENAMQALPELLKVAITIDTSVPALIAAKVNLRISYLEKLNEAIATSRDATAKQAMQERARVLTIELQRLGYLPDGKRIQLSSNPNIPPGLEIPPVKINRPVRGQDGENPLALLEEAMQLVEKPTHRADLAGPTNWELARVKFWKAVDLADKLTPEQKQAEIERVRAELERLQAMIKDGKDRTGATTVDLTPVRRQELEQQKKKLEERIDLVTWLPFYARFYAAVAFCRNGREDEGRVLLQEAKEGPRGGEHYRLASRVLELLDVRPKVVLDDDTVFGWLDTSDQVSAQALRNLNAREIAFPDVLQVTSDASLRMRRSLDVGDHLYTQALKAAGTINRDQVIKDIAYSIDVLTKNQNPEDNNQVLHPDQAVILRAIVIGDLERLLLTATVQESWAQSLSFAGQFDSAATHLKEAQKAALALTQSTGGQQSVMQLVRQEIERTDKHLQALQTQIEEERKKPVADVQKIAALKAEQSDHKEYKDALASMELRVISPSIQLASLYQGVAIVPQAGQGFIETKRAPDAARMKGALLAAINADPVFKQNNELKNLLAWANAEQASKRSWIDTIADCGGIMAAIIALELCMSRGRSALASAPPTLRYLANPRIQQVLRYTAPILAPSLAGGTVNWGVHALSGDFSHEWFIRGAGPNALLGAGVYWGGVALNAYFGRALTAEAVGANLAARSPQEVTQMFINANLYVPPRLQEIVRNGHTWAQAAASTSHGSVNRLIGELLTPGSLTAAGAGMARGRLLATFLRNPNTATMLQGTELAVAAGTASSRTGAALGWMRGRLPGTISSDFNVTNAAAQYAAIRNTRWLIGSGQSAIFSVGNLTVRIHDQMQNPETLERYSIWHVPSWFRATGSALSEYNPITLHGLRNILYDVAIGGATLSSTSIGPPATRERFLEWSTIMPWNLFHLHTRTLPASWQRAFWNQYLSPVTSAFHYTLWQEFNYNIPAAIGFYDAVFNKPQPLRNDAFIPRVQQPQRNRFLRQHQKLPGWEPLPK